MAASNNNGGSTGKRLYYSIAYGKLSTRLKEAPESYSEIEEADLKAKIQNVENIDLRNKYVLKTGDYPYSVFYDSLTGVLTTQEKVENEHGVFLNLTVLDSDGDTSVIQTKLYSKYAENLLNRLLNAPQGSTFTFSPYAMPQTMEIEGKNKSFYNQGVSVKVNGEKVEPKYKHDDKELPATQQVKVQGKTTTSRDARVDFLYNKFAEVFQPSTDAPVAQEVPKSTSNGYSPKQEVQGSVDNSKSFTADKHQDLPF